MAEIAREYQLLSVPLVLGLGFCLSYFYIYQWAKRSGEWGRSLGGFFPVLLVGRSLRLRSPPLRSIPHFLISAGIFYASVFLAVSILV